jgi:hypothetical protein
MAQAIPRGTAMRRENTAIYNVPITSDRIPQLGLTYEVGFQSVLKKNSNGDIRVNACRPIIERKKKIPSNNNTVDMPLKAKNQAINLSINFLLIIANTTCKLHSFRDFLGNNEPTNSY